jgi:hypothetical protein
MCVGVHEQPLVSVLAQQVELARTVHLHQLWPYMFNDPPAKSTLYVCHIYFMVLVEAVVASVRLFLYHICLLFAGSGRLCYQ